LHEALYERLIAFAAEGTRVVLVLDEAHLLGPDMLENLRLLTNLETEDKKLVTLLLFGQNELEETLARRELRPLRQRIALWHRLKPFGWLETGEYIRHRLDRARDGATLGFTRAALLAARRYTGGVPRRINLICDRALLAAFARGKARVDLSLLAAAAREIGGFVA
jgi:general secretion pathway protein A